MSVRGRGGRLEIRLGLEVAMDGKSLADRIISVAARQQATFATRAAAKKEWNAGEQRRVTAETLLIEEVTHRLST